MTEALVAVLLLLGFLVLLGCWLSKPRSRRSLQRQGGGD